MSLLAHNHFAVIMTLLKITVVVHWSRNCWWTANRCSPTRMWKRTAVGNAGTPKSLIGLKVKHFQQQELLLGFIRAALFIIMLWLHILQYVHVLYPNGRSWVMCDKTALWWSRNAEMSLPTVLYQTFVFGTDPKKCHTITILVVLAMKVKL